MFVAVHVSLDFNDVPCSSKSCATQNNKGACFVMGRGELFSFRTPNNRLLMALAECHWSQKTTCHQFLSRVQRWSCKPPACNQRQSKFVAVKVTGSDAVTKSLIIQEMKQFILSWVTSSGNLSELWKPRTRESILFFILLGWSQLSHDAISAPWTSCQIRKSVGCACAENAGNVFPATVC